MPGMNLTRDEAAVRAQLLHVESYDIDLDLSATGGTYPSTTVVRFSCVEPGASTFIDLIAPEVHKVTFNGNELNPADVFDGLRITLDDLAEDNVLRVEASCAYMHTGQGLHRFVDPVDKETYLYTQFETADARRMLACFEQPDLKATYALSITAPSDWEVISNSPTPTPTLDSDGNGRWVFTPTPRMSTYIVALVAGAYHVERDAYAGPDHTVPLGVFCRQSLAPFLDAEDIFTVTKQGFAFFETLFDYPYPFEKFDQLFVPEFNAGAMENAGAVTITDYYVFRSRETDAEYANRAETILHELAHMWFGDLVTMRWWDDLWLNESFATYASVLCQVSVTQWPYRWTQFANTEKPWAYTQDQMPSTHPVAADIRDLEDVEVNFDGITYAKGASVLKQLVAWVGQDEFFEGMRRYFKRHEWSNTSLADLLACLTETSGRELQSWSKEWLETAGVATLRPDFEVDAEGAFTSFAVLQEAPESHPTLRSHRLGIGLYDRSTDGLHRRHRVEIDITGPRTDVPELVGERQPDVVLINDDDLTYAKIRLDTRSLRTVIEAVSEFDDPLARALCWTAAWDMCRDGEFATRDFIDLVLGGVGSEGDSSVIRTLVQSAQTAVEIYSAPDDRDAARARWADGLLALAREAEPASDSQLAFARGFSRAAATSAHGEVLSSWLSDDDVPEGLAIDTDLRWQFVQRLAALGAIGEDEITAEQDRDDTITGRERAANARAAQPHADAKAAAWDLAVVQSDTPNGTQYQAITGFHQIGQEDLQRPYVDMYFDVITEVWQRMTHEMAQNVVFGLYPRLLATPDTVARTNEWLSSADPPPALRRLVVEGRDRIERALRCQECDATATR